MVSTVKLFVLLIKDVIAQKLNEHTKYFSHENLIVNFLKHFKPLLFFNIFSMYTGNITFNFIKI